MELDIADSGDRPALEASLDASEAVQRLARFLYDQEQKLWVDRPYWDNLSSSDKSDWYEIIRSIADLDDYWRIIFDTNNNTVGGSAETFE